jgi:hypothetical protein
VSFIEVESWEIAAGKQSEHDEMIRRWFRYVQEHHPEMFAEWKSARYYRQIDKEGRPTGRYVMLFEFYSVEGHHAYKARRKDWSGPYADYKKVDPYELFDHSSVKMEYWEPQETALWFDLGTR